jgi:ABC-type multidrug transport system fused ATPase/permease subunit
MWALIKRFFSLIVPFLWHTKASRVATTITLSIVLVNTLVQTITPWLFGHLLKHCLALNTTAVILIVTLLLLCWYAHGTLGHLHAIVFFSVINRAIRTIRMRVIMQLHQTPLQSWEEYGVTEIISASARVSQSIRSFMGTTFVKSLPALVKVGTLSRLPCFMYTAARGTFSPLVCTHLWLCVRRHRVLPRVAQPLLWEATDQAIRL